MDGRQKRISQLEKVLDAIDELNMNAKWFVMQTLEQELGVKVQLAKDKVTE